MLADVTKLILAIAALIAVCGFLFLLYKPPKNLRKFRLKDYFEGEFAEKERAPQPEPASVPALGAAEPAPAPGALQTVSVSEAAVAEEPSFGAIWTAFEKHEYAEGMKLARKVVASEMNPSARASEAAYYWVAHVEGNPEAYGDAEKYATNHPNSYGAQFYFGLISDRSGKAQIAVDLLTKALALGADSEERVNAAVALERVLTRLDRHKDALAVLNGQLTITDEPALRAKLFVSMAKAFENATPPDRRTMFLMYELAIQNTPDDTGLRFEVAYKYSDLNAHELAFSHYQRLLRNKPDHVVAHNNIGVDAERLSLPLTAVSHYKASQQADNTLASSNLANKLIDAGFKDEAEAILAAAKAKPDVHRNVSLSLGRLAEAELAEEGKINQISERAGKIRRWHVRHGEAMLQQCDSATLTGTYTGAPVGLELTVQADGDAKGTFALTSTMAAVLSGRVTGSALSFDWTGESNEQGVWSSYLTRKSGHGVLIASGDGQLDGYLTEGDQRIDSTDIDKWTQWHLSKAVP